MALNKQDARAAILKHVRTKNYTPVKATRLAQQLGYAKHELDAFKRLIKDMVSEGVLRYSGGHTIKATEVPLMAKAGKTVTGTFFRKGSGRGVVRQAGLEKVKENEISIKGEGLLNASDRDTVSVVLEDRINRKGQRIGHIVDVLERKTENFVGTFKLIGSSGYVEVDGGLFDRPVWVGDARSKNIEPETKVVIEMTRFPEGERQGEGVITEILGPRGIPEVDTMSVIRRYELPDKFPEEALAYTRSIINRYPDTIPPDRLDITNTYIITIDPEDAQDFDDAISLKTLSNGSVILGVHIADVSYFVDEGSVLDQEARLRGNSVYLPDRVIPMLPEQICNSMASLQPNQNRFCKSVFMEFTADGIQTNVDIKNTVIRSAERLTYEQVDQFFETGSANIALQTKELLTGVRKLAKTLRKRRNEKGCLHLNLPELKILYNTRGEITGIRKEVNTESHSLIEEFMVSANEAVAEFLTQQGETFIRRIHLPPVPKKVARFDRFVSELGIQEIQGKDQYRIQDVLQKTAGTPYEYPVHQAALRAMQRAEYSPSQDGHFALASSCYCHFTSPIRRYADLTVHRLLQAIITGAKPNRHLDEIGFLAEHLTDTEQRAEDAERDIIALKIAKYMETKIGQNLTAVISGVSKSGLFIQGIEIPVESVLSLSVLPPDEYYFEEDLQTLTGYRAENCFRLGDKLNLKVEGVKYDSEGPHVQFKFLSVAQRVKPIGVDGAPLSHTAQKTGNPRQFTPLSKNWMTLSKRSKPKNKRNVK